jgi:hypothetical protein
VNRLGVDVSYKWVNGVDVDADEFCLVPHEVEEFTACPRADAPRRRPRRVVL